jgi:hypothetical protein
MFGYPKVHNPPAFMVHDDKGMDRLEERCHYRHEIAGPDVLAVRLQESRPRLSRRRLRAHRVSVLLDRPLRHPNFQLQQLASDAFGSPQRIFASHPPNQRNRFRRQALWLSLHMYARLELPE